MPYVKTEWTSTSYVTPTPLNHIEQGIYDATNTADTASSTATSALTKATNALKPVVLFSKTPASNQTYSSLLNEIDTELDNLDAQVIADGYLKIGSDIYRVGEITNSRYSFVSNYMSNDGAINTRMLQIKSSGSVYRRMYITAAGVATNTDYSTEVITDTATFYGRVQT